MSEDDEGKRPPGEPPAEGGGPAGPGEGKPPAGGPGELGELFLELLGNLADKARQLTAELKAAQEATGAAAATPAAPAEVAASPAQPPAAEDESKPTEAQEPDDPDDPGNVVDLQLERLRRRIAQREPGEAERRLGDSVKESLARYVQQEILDKRGERSEIPLDREFVARHARGLLGALFDGALQATQATQATPPVVEPPPAPVAAEPPAAPADPPPAPPPVAEATPAPATPAADASVKLTLQLDLGPLVHGPTGKGKPGDEGGAR